MIMPSLEASEGEGDEAEGSQSAPHPQQEAMDTDAPAVEQEPPRVRIFSPSRAPNRVERLESTIGVLQIDLVEVRATHAVNHTEVMTRLAILQ